MASEMTDQMKPLADFYAKWSRDSLDMMSKGMAMYNKMNRAWVDVAEGSSGERPDDVLKKWTEAFSGSYNELFEMYMQPFKAMGAGSIPGKEAWEEAFAKWQKMFVLTPPVDTGSSATDEFSNFSKGWFEGYSRICQAWVESMQKMGDACKAAGAEGEKPESAMTAVSEISDRFMKDWSAFVTEQAQSFLSLWKSRLPVEKKETKKAGKE
mgnify:CR=1 FL=1